MTHNIVSIIIEHYSFINVITNYYSLVVSLIIFLHSCDGSKMYGSIRFKINNVIQNITYYSKCDVLFKILMTKLVIILFASFIA